MKISVSFTLRLVCLMGALSLASCSSSDDDDGTDTTTNTPVNEATDTADIAPDNEGTDTTTTTPINDETDTTSNTPIDDDTDTSDNQPVNADADVADNLPVSNVELAETLDDTALAQLEGIYLRRGYGDLFVYENNRTTIYALTENTCLQIISVGGLNGLSADEVAQTRFELQGDELTLAIPGDAFVTQLQRQESLPARCDDTVARDAQGVFDYLWETFDEYYAFFDLRNVDWAAEYARRLPEVATATDDVALFSLLSDLLS